MSRSLLKKRLLFPSVKTPLSASRKDVDPKKDKTDLKCANLIWIFRDFPNISRTFDAIKSPLFYGPSKVAWQLTVSPKKMVAGRQYLSLILVLADLGKSTRQAINAKYELSIHGPDGVSLKSAERQSLSFIEFKKGEGYGREEIVLSSNLASLAKGHLSIQCKVWMKEDGGKVEDEVAIDFVLQSHGIKAPVRKRVLAAHNALFAREFKECIGVEIPGFEAELMNDMLSYIYSKRTNLSDDNLLPDLVKIAGKYGVDRLKNDCDAVMSSKLTVDTAADKLLISHLYTTESSVKSQIIKFIKLHKDRVKASRRFKNAKAKFPFLFAKVWTPYFGAL